ncbi:MAG: PEP-CTERM sorting domain-containing protein [bacterium]|nr:PEP-CTERM sorting domain-containing protein [bacterium]
MLNLNGTICVGAVVVAATQACAGVVPGGTYTPLAFGPLVDPGNGAYYTQVYDISADGSSYVGILSDGRAAYVYQGDLFIQTGGSAAAAITPDGSMAVGGPAGGPPMQWLAADASNGNIAGTVYDSPHAGSAGSFAYGVNRDGTVLNIVQGGVSSAVLTPSGIRRANDAFIAQFPTGAFAGANRGIAVDAPVQVVLGNSQGVYTTNAFRWNYETDDVSPLNIPAGGTSVTVGGSASSSNISYDGSIVGGAARVPSIAPLDVPIYWDASGEAHVIPGVGGRLMGTMNAVNYTGTFGGGNLFGAGLPNHAFLYDFANDITYDLNDLFAEVIPDGWLLTHTTDISDDGSKIFARALAPDGTARFVELTGVVPAPATAILLGLAGVGAARRRR